MSCATFINGTTQDIAVDSTPIKVMVEIRRFGGALEASGTAPLLTSLRRDNEYEVTVSAPGYEPAQVRIKKDFEMWVLGNVLCGAIVVGGVLDLITGAFWRLSPDDIVVTVAPSRPAAPTTSPSTPASGTVALFMARDDQGNLRMQSVPLLRERR